MSLCECGQRLGTLVELPNVRSVAPDSAEEKGNAAERIEKARTCRSGVTQRRWEFRGDGTSSGGTEPCGAIKESKCNFELETLEAEPTLTPNE
jgi:hypothetical protein